jgi:hypothetical protein
MSVRGDAVTKASHEHSEGGRFVRKKRYCASLLSCTECINVSINAAGEARLTTSLSAVRQPVTSDQLLDSLC